MNPTEKVHPEQAGPQVETQDGKKTQKSDQETLQGPEDSENQARDTCKLEDSPSNLQQVSAQQCDYPNPNEQSLMHQYPLPYGYPPQHQMHHPGAMGQYMYYHHPPPMHQHQYGGPQNQQEEDGAPQGQGGNPGHWGGPPPPYSMEGHYYGYPNSYQAYDMDPHYYDQQYRNSDKQISPGHTGKGTPVHSKLRKANTMGDNCDMNAVNHHYNLSLMWMPPPPVYGQNQMVPPVYGQNQMVPPVYGQNQMVPPVYGQNQMVPPVYGQNLMGPQAQSYNPGQQVIPPAGLGPEVCNDNNKNVALRETGNADLGYKEVQACDLEAPGQMEKQDEGGEGLVQP
jgi:hypothetical protein